jgi:hypothetical protein
MRESVSIGLILRRMLHEPVGRSHSGKGNTKVQ